jgi:outer membrane receptor protein involved in Fe transport
LDENSHGGSIDLTVPAGKTKFRTGALVERRERSFGIRAFATDASRLDAAHYGLVVLPVDKVFAPENYGAGKFGFIPVTTFTGAYDGDFALNAGYAMVDRPQMLFGRRFRLVGGARVEGATLNVKTEPEIGAPPVITSLAHTDWLPSANLAWIARENLNVRLAYGRAVNRPEMRELSDVLYYDFDHEQNVRGNPELERALIDNYDVRVEFFPHVGEVIAASYFYKNMDNAIEERLIASPERFVRTWFNSSSGKNYGVEFECRKTLGFLGEALNSISVTGNYTRIKSAIEYTDARTDGSGAVISRRLERVMQGQSPWSFNTSVLYLVPRYRASLNVLYGKVGRRLDAVGDSRDEDVYEESRDLLELAVTKSFRSRWEAKLTAKNLLREDENLTTGPGRSTFAKISRDQIWSFSLSRAL